VIRMLLEFEVIIGLCEVITGLFLGQLSQLNLLSFLLSGSCVQLYIQLSAFLLDFDGHRQQAVYQ